MHVCLVGTMSSTHIAKFSLRESRRHQSQTSDYGSHPSRLQVGGNVRVLDRGRRIAGATLSHQIL